LLELVDASNLLSNCARLNVAAGGLSGQGFFGRIRNQPLNTMSHSRKFKLQHWLSMEDRVERKSSSGKGSRPPIILLPVVSWLKRA